MPCRVLCLKVNQSKGTYLPVTTGKINKDNDSLSENIKLIQEFVDYIGDIQITT